MAGEAKTNAFVIGTATVMIGPQADLFDLNPADHSIGLVKNFTMSSEPSYTELTQGVKNNIVYSVLTQNPVRASMEVYEITAQNLAYGLGLDGSAMVTPSTFESLKTQITGNDGAPITSAIFDNIVSQVAKFPSGQWIMIQDTGSDRVHVAKLSAVTTFATPAHTLTFTNHGIKTGVNFPVGSKIQPMNRVDVGSKAEQPYLAAKIVGILPDLNKPVVILIPKLRITRGFSLAFQSDNFGNLPYEFTPYEQVSTDPFYAEFLDKGVAALLTPA